ncbi:cytidylyltransferase domain-containing protein [Plastorhodobacter daqingensis]|uniref:Cytidylyltransferase domain-containing protein n=1 Tax=Plastorhodobacter daqingensis TaxID=1387281 RepID=A0ABW2UHG0_9RHOB
MTEMPLIAIVPVRGGSRGLPGKNTRDLLGKPLYRHALDQAHAAGVKLCLLSTDIPALLRADHGPGVQVVPRPGELARDDTPMDPVLAHALQVVDGPARVVLLQATSPLREPEDIAAAVALHSAGRFDLVMSVTRTPSHILKYGMVKEGAFRPVAGADYCFMNRQALPEVYRPNGAVYVFDADWFRRNGRLATDRIGAVEMPPERALDIDTAEDFAQVESVMRTRGAQ